MGSKNTRSQVFYRTIVAELNKKHIPFLLGGGFALRFYTAIRRETKDLDIFCKSGDYPRIITLFSQKKYQTEITDDRWLAKIKKGVDFIDLIFGGVNSLVPVDDTWFENNQTVDFFGAKVHLISPEDFIWSKIYMQNRMRFDGADINHMLLKNPDKINLITRLKFQLQLPTSKDPVCRGPLLSRSDYNIDIKDWGFKTIT